MDNILEQNKLLLDLALHRYDEDERRNQLVDSKNSSFIAFLGVMLTIQSTLISYIITFINGKLTLEVIILVIVFVGSLICYAISLGYFVSSLKFLSKFQVAPVVSELIDFGKSNTSEEYIIQNTIVSLDKCIEDNTVLSEEKTSKGIHGCMFLELGVIFTVIFIALFILISIW